MQVLRWFAYFREPVVDACEPEQQRVRRVAIHYYLVDDTLDVCEPHQSDSGIMQACSLQPCLCGCASCIAVLACIHWASRGITAALDPSS